MTDFADLIRQGAANAWLFIPTAIMLGALHGLEPGHSKTMMAAFIITIHGTVADAVLLGVAAALSHSLVVWVLAVAALAWGSDLIAERAEPYLLMASGLAVLAIALAMALTQWRARRGSHGHDHRHRHGHDHGHPHAHSHESAHAADFRTATAAGRPSRLRIALFGLTGGLLPCPAAITVLLICLNLKQVNLGVAMVASFSVGLGLTLVGVGIAAALGLRAMGQRGGRLAPIVERLPYLSTVVMAAIGLVMLASGLRHAV